MALCDNTAVADPALFPVFAQALPMHARSGAGERHSLTVDFRSYSNSL